MNTSIPYPSTAGAGVNPVPVPAAEPSYAAVSWSAVAAGAAAAAALSFILLVLGVGLGLSAVSPWSYSAQPLGKATILWVSLMELASSAVGGYMAGRLRVRWSGVHGDEVYFRDTAHGLLAWAAATLLVAALMAGAVRAALGGAIDAGAAVANIVPDNATGKVAEVVAETVAPAAPSGGGTPAARQAARTPAAGDAASADANGPASSNFSAYYADVLLRSDTVPVPDVTGAALRAELVRLLDRQPGGLSDEDRQYVARMVAKRTGLEPSDAERRVDDVLARLNQARADAAARAKAAADAARKAGAYSALWMFFALLLGAFAASLAATFGGRQRDLASPPRS
ncbi:hypothetical protein [Pseudoduganella rivuli]|uniref:hypothetical protein n=1 Tax=Pseudoduganella rivuli TaxID=2666085 RepID=UPI0012AFEBBC|nr:hypothetical protein [Pseudoduganella rivuli]